MPCLNVSTNVNLEGVDTSAILAEASKSVANIIGKLEAYVMIVLKGSVPMAFGGTQEPAAYGKLVSIGGLNPDVNKKLSAGIAIIMFSLEFCCLLGPSGTRTCSMFACFALRIDHVNNHMLFGAIFLILHMLRFYLSS
ncbi:unnamed protein product [Miscanthus lutarioriparius]|uniref:Uncharacterized protein n=1 Tax=Miscanthus lutarioriparius TaxID=422564 RepID=A0A811QPN4_9POAL|nr:unnamed protein product [Miscanthus lutarioriparius]